MNQHVMPELGNQSIPETFYLCKLDLSYMRHGLWAGASYLLDEAYQALKNSEQNSVCQRFKREISKISPRNQAELGFADECLTETARDEEKTRTFSPDRTYRLIHGAVGVVKAWAAEALQNKHLVIAVNHTQNGGFHSTNFFLELSRRTAGLNLTVVFDEVPADEKVASVNKQPFVNVASSLDSDLSLFNTTQEGKQEFKDDVTEKDLLELDSLFWEENYLSYLNKNQFNSIESVPLEAQLVVLWYLNGNGYYYECLPYCLHIIANLDDAVDLAYQRNPDRKGGKEKLLCDIMFKISAILSLTGRGEMVIDLITNQVLPYLTTTSLASHMHYFLSMAHLRYVESVDLELAGKEINKAIELTRQCMKDNPDDASLVFHKVFFDNGLALLKLKQRDARAAIDLCEQGYELITSRLGADKHKLHRSVLLNNIAKVYLGFKQYEESIAYYKEALALDPFYSEFHNELGNIYQTIEDYPKAMEEYQQAMNYSSPYFELYSNMGICAQNLGSDEHAKAYFEMSLELNPYQEDVLVSLAELYEQEERKDEAFQCYSKAIQIDSALVTALVNRAVLFFERNDLQGALTDLEQAKKVEGDNEAVDANLDFIKEKIAESKLETA